MLARDIMRSEVVSVRPDFPVHDVARVLMERKLRAVPVVDDAGRPIGIIREAELVSGGAAGQLGPIRAADVKRLSEDFVAALRTDQRLAHHVMSAPVITVSEDAEVPEIARLLSSYRFDSVFVLRHRRIVGIVDWSDLVHATTIDGSPLPTSDGPSEAIRTPSPSEAGKHRLHLSHFRDLLSNHERNEAQRISEERQAQAKRRHMEVSELINRHIADAQWEAMLHDAESAAARGEKELLLLRFPSDLCRDGGRAVNVREPDWPDTLRGEAAEIYLRWKNDLQPSGFRLAARILDFPGGIPGDIGLFLSWGDL